MSPRRTAQALPIPKGTRVRFTRDGLGASERNDLGHMTDDVYGVGDTGIVACPHPNARSCPGWFYVAVDSKLGEARTLYVGVSSTCVEPVS